MATTTITWVQDFQFVGTDSTKHSIVIAPPGEANGTGVKPSDLLLLSVGSCTAYDVVNILTKKRKKLRHLGLRVEGEQDSNPPWSFQRIHIHFTVCGDDVSERDVARAIHLSHEKYCSVAATLRKSVELTVSYDVNGVGAGGDADEHAGETDDSR